MNTRLFLVEILPSVEEDCLCGCNGKITRNYFRRADGTGERMGFFDIPVGGCFKDSEGRVCVIVWEDREKTRSHPFHPKGCKNMAGSPIEWSIDGEIPAITCVPSIFVNPPNGWHGFIRNGELVDA